MTTFDLAEVRDFAADLDAGLARHATSESMGGPGLDNVLRDYAELCRDCCDQIKRWGDAVYSGRTAFEAESERVLKEGGERLYSRAREIDQAASQSATIASRPSEAHLALHTALVELDRLLRGWVTPSLAVGPSAKRWRYPEQAATEEEIQRVASLPPLPADWQPADPRLPIPRRKPRTS